MARLFAGTALFDAFEQIVHASAELGSHIGLKMQFRDTKKLQPDGELVAQEWAGVLERRKSLLNVRSIGDSDPDQRVTLIGRNLHAGDGSGADAWIGELVADQFGQFFAERLGDPLSAMLHRKLFDPLHAGTHQNAPQEAGRLALHALQHLLGVRVIPGDGDG